MKGDDFQFISISEEDALRTYKITKYRPMPTFETDFVEIQHGHFSDLCFWNPTSDGGKGEWQYLTTRLI